MRVTQSMLTKNNLGYISQSYDRLQKYSDQLVSGKKISRPSDDPVIAMKGMRYRTQVLEVEQFQRNLGEVYNWMDNSDAAYDKVTSALHRIRELTVQAANDTYEDTQRANIAKEIEELQEHIASLANTKFNNKYLFNGTDTTTPPVDLDKIDVPPSVIGTADAPAADHVVTYNGKQFTYDSSGTGYIYKNGAESITINPGGTPQIQYTDGATTPVTLNETDIMISHNESFSTNTNDVQIEVMNGIRLAVNSDPQKVFNTQLFKDLRDLIHVLNGSSKDDGTESVADNISTFIEKISGHIDAVTSERAELGAKINRTEMVESRLGQQEIISKRTLSENEDIDIEKVIMELKTQESLHRAALAAGARIIQPTLMDFLR